MKLRRITFCAAIALGGVIGSTGEAMAQFSLRGVGQATSSTQPKVDMPLNVSEIDGRVVNATEAELQRRIVWRERNDVDFRASLTGAVTQFNKSWTTNNQNVVSSEVSMYYYHTYTRARHTSLFKFDAIYGMNFIEDLWFKNQDMMKLYYLASWKVSDHGGLRHWAYSASTTFASQFAEGFKSRTERELWSNFMAPGTVNVGAGMTYTSPNPKLPFIVTINPLSGDALFVLDDRISEERRLKLGIQPGPDGRPVDAEGRPINNKIEGGSSVNVAFNRTFTFGKRDGATLQYITTLNSFYGWMTQLGRHEIGGGSGSGEASGGDGVAVSGPRAILPTVGWTNSLILNPLRFLSLEFRTTTLYDRSQVDRVQMQYYLRLGLTYRYRNR